MTVVIALSMPPRELSPNARCHWSVKASATSVYREEARIMGLTARRLHESKGATFPLQPIVQADVTFVVTDNRRHDEQNLLASFKAGFDGIVDSGLLEDDNATALHIASVRVVRGPSSGVQVSLTGAGE